MCIEGKDSSDWKLVDAHDVIVHISKNRSFYDLEKMWSEEIPKESYDMRKSILLVFLILNFHSQLL